MTLNCYPVPGKAKSDMICRAFEFGAPKSAKGSVFFGTEDDGPEEFQWLLYCYHCARRLNDPDDPSTKEVEPQLCARCVGPAK